MALKIFLSHSANDDALASALVDCLLSSMILEDSELRCTSVPGHKLSVGTDFAAALLEDIGESSVVIGLITKSALSSSWVLFELGATWGSKKHMKPIVTGEVDIKALPGPVSGRHVARLSSRADVAQLLSEVTKLVNATPRSAAKIDKAIETLLSAHAAHVSAQTVTHSKNKVETNSKELVVAGMSLSELVRYWRVRKSKFQLSMPAASRMLSPRFLTFLSVIPIHCLMAFKAIGIEILQRAFYTKSWDFGYYRTD